MTELSRSLQDFLIPDLSSDLASHRLMFRPMQKPRRGLTVWDQEGQQKTARQILLMAGASRQCHLETLDY